MSEMLQRVQTILDRLSLNVLGVEFQIEAHHDKEFENGRVYLQVSYTAPCTNTGELLPWKGGKHYLSKHMTDDEIIKRAWVAFESAVKHEIMEGFKVDGIILFNPHVSYEELLKVSHIEITRSASQ